MRKTMLLMVVLLILLTGCTIKREAIRRSGNFRVWSLSFKDVQSVFAPQGDYYTATLEAEKMPSGKTMYQNMSKKQKADAIEPTKLSSFDLLLEYLKLPDAEKVFKGQAYAYSLSLLEPTLMKNSLAFNNWKLIVDAVNDQTHFTDADFVFPGTVYGSWIPRNSNAHLAIHSGILASALKTEGAVTVCAVLNDEKDSRTDKYEQEWNGLWRFHNLMQFSDTFMAVSSTGMSRMDCGNYDMRLNYEAESKVRSYLTWLLQNKPENFANGREMRNLFETVISNQADRLALNGDTSDEALCTIVVRDLPEYVQKTQ